MTTLRDALSNAFSDADEGTLVAEDAPSIEVPEVDHIAQEAKSERVRDDSGRFAKSEVKISEESSKKLDDPIQDKVEAKVETKVDLPSRKPPSSWKKDYWGHWDKVASNPELAPMADYIEQRENEYAKGVSTYREEAMKAKALQDAIAPFIPTMQAYGVQPEVEVKNLLAAHHTLVQASPQDKLRMFAKLATDYGVPLGALTGQQVDPQAQQLLQEIHALKSQYGQMYQSQQQQKQVQEMREQQEIVQTIEQFKADAPFFEEARETMAGLLQAGLAPDLKAAYEKAIRLNDGLWKREQARQAEAADKERQAKLAHKKATAVSPRSLAPTAQGSGVRNGKDVRSIIASAFDEHLGRL